MKGKLLDVKVVKYSMLPRLQFDIEIENDSNTHKAWIHGWTGEFSLQQPYMLIGNLSTNFDFLTLEPSAKGKIKAFCEVSPEKLDIIEDQRKGADLQIFISLNLIRSLIPKTAPPPYDISLMGSEHISVESSSGERITEIPRSVWDDRLEELNYGRIMTLRLDFPPPPLGTQLDKSIGHLQDAEGKINDGEWSDSLASCRKSIEELQKLVGHGAEKREAFFQNMLKDKEKAKDCEDLWEAVQKAKNFASGGPHTYWIKTADKRDAELAIRVTSAFVHYFAKNLARK